MTRNNHLVSDSVGGTINCMTEKTNNGRITAQGTETLKQKLQ